MDSRGEFVPVRVSKKEDEIAQGRFIVHPAVREEVMHEGTKNIIYSYEKL